MQRILSREEANLLRQLLGEARNVVVLCHKNPDGDAIGSTAAMTLLLRGMGKRVTAIMPNPAPDFLGWLPTADEILLGDRQHLKVDNALQRADLIVMLDFSVMYEMSQM